MRKLVLPVVMVFAACGAPMTQDDAGAVDAGLVVDAGTDAGTGSMDAGMDAGHDAGTADAGAVDAGTDAFVMLAAFPATISRTNNALSVDLTELAGGPVTGATVTLSLWYPDHGHGAVAPSTTEPTPGHFAATVNFPMAGTCDVTVTAVSNGRTVVKKLSVRVP